jgi:hypothetical protein
MFFYPQLPSKGSSFETGGAARSEVCWWAPPIHASKNYLFFLRRSATLYTDMERHMIHGVPNIIIGYISMQTQSSEDLFLFVM